MKIFIFQPDSCLEKGMIITMDGFKNFMTQYSGAIIGGVIAILVLLTGLHKLFIAIVVIFIGIFIGNYIQRNKVDVKEKLKNFIDRL